MIKLLLVGADNSNAIERHYLKHMQNMSGIAGAELFGIQNLFMQHYQKSIFNKVLFRLGYRNIYKKINEQLLRKADEFKPDVVFVFKGMEVLPDTLKRFRSQGIKLVNYNPDSPFIFSGRGSGNPNVIKSLELYDLHFTYSEDIRREMELRHPEIPVRILPFGYELSDELYQLASAQPEIMKLCFVGNADRHRAALITALANKGVSIDVYGFFWPRFVKHKNITTYPAVLQDEFWLTLRKYRIQLNIMRPHNLMSHNMRTFEVPATGGIQLAPKNEEHRHFFKEGEEIFLFDDVEECISNIQHLLSLDAADSEKIREAARNRSVQSGYSYRDRANFVVESIKNLL